MQKFEEGMRLILEASELWWKFLSFTSRIMQPNAFGLPSCQRQIIGRFSPFLMSAIGH
ncbi:hypothetical protein ACLB1Q_34185 [Escherichia coli]